VTRIHVPIALRWGDQDPYGHINNVHILRILEEARIRVFWKPDPRDATAVNAEASPLAILDATSGGTTQHLVSSHHIQYLVPIPYLRGEVDVQVWIGKLSGAGMEVCYEIHDPVDSQTDTIYVRATTTTALFDTAGGRLRRMTAEEEAAWRPYTDEPLAFRR